MRVQSSEIPDDFIEDEELVASPEGISASHDSDLHSAIDMIPSPSRNYTGSGSRDCSYGGSWR